MEKGQNCTSYLTIAGSCCVVFEKDTELFSDVVVFVLVKSLTFQVLKTLFGLNL